MNESVRCSQHPRDRAGWTCSACGLDLCLRCAARRKAGHGYVVVCQHCGEFANPIMVARARQSFPQMLPDALTFPFSRNGFLMMAACGAVFGALKLGGGIASVIAAGSLVSYLFLVVRSSAAGNADVPESEDFSNLGELVFSLLKAAVAVAVGALPWALYVYFLRPRLGMQAPLVGDPMAYLALALGGAWTPMALLLAAVNSPFVSLINPVLAVQCVRRLGVDYFLCAFLLWVTVLGWLFLSGTGILFVHTFSKVPLFPRLLAEVVAMYPALVGSRLLGNLLFVRGADISYGTSNDYLEPALGSILPPEEKQAASQQTPPPAELPAADPFASLLSTPSPATGTSSPVPTTPTPAPRPPAGLPRNFKANPPTTPTPLDDAALVEAILGPHGAGSTPAPLSSPTSTPPPASADWRSLPPVPEQSRSSRPAPAPSPSAPSEAASDMSRTILVTPPTDAEIQALAAAGQFDAVANAYRARRGAVASLTAEQLVRTAEAALARADLQTASHAYKRVGFDHPRSPDAPRALLRAGRMLREQLKKDLEGTKLLDHLIRVYPDTAEAREARTLLGRAA